MQRYLFAFCAASAMVVSLVNSPASRAGPVVLPSADPVECSEGGDEPAKGKFSIELGITSKGIIFKVGVSAVKPEPAPAIDAVCPTVVPAYLEHVLKLVGEALTPKRAAVEVEPIAAGNNEQNRPVEGQLFEQVNVRIKDVPLKQAIKNLAYTSGMKIALDHRALADAKVNIDFPVSLTVEHTSVHTALQQLLHPLRLTYEIRDDVVMITTPDLRPNREVGAREAKAKAELAQRLFEIGERSRRAGDYDKSRVYYQQVHMLAPTSLHGRVAIVRLVEIEDRMREAEEQGIPGRDTDPEQSFRDLQNRSIPLGLVEVSY